MGLIYKDGIPYGGGGHSIVNSENEILPQRNRVQINGANIVDDPQHDKTILNIENVDISGKADKVTSATNGNLASLDANGNLTDSGIPSVTTLTSTDPYTYRKSLGNLADMEIVGASVGWNQYIPNKSTTETNGITFTVDNAAHTITISGTASANANLVFYPDSVATGFKGVTGHKYLYITNNKGLTESSITHRFVANGGFSSIGGIGSLTSENYYSFKECVDATKGAGILLRVTSGTDCTTPVVVHYSNLIDLTQAFNPTIADAIYAMEQAAAGAGVAFFRKYFPKDYYAYDAGSIQSVCVGSRKVVGFNQWDEQWEIGAYSEITGEKVNDNTRIRCKNFIPVIPNTNYCYKGPDPRRLIPYYYGKGQNFIGYPGEINPNEVFTIPDNVYYLTFQLGQAYGTTYKNDICINISDPSKNGTYEPYTSTAYPFDSTKQLRGLFSLEGGELKASGDIYTADGNIQRKYGIVDLGTKTWSLVNSSSSRQVWETFLSDINPMPSENIPIKAVCAQFIPVSKSTTWKPGDMSYSTYTSESGKNVALITNANQYPDAATFKTAMSGVYLVYELATPTTESAQPYQTPQRAYIDGTEEFTDGLTRDVMVPVGNNTTYQQDKILPSVEDYVDAVADNIDLSSKADKVANATNGHLAGLDANGNLTDSGSKASDFATSSQAIPSGGTTGQVLAKASGTDYDTEWVDTSGGSGGHTIVNSSSSSMTARSKLKFANATVTDDPTNDQTIITTNPLSAVQTATLDATNFIKAESNSGVYYVTRSGFCEVQINTIKAKNAGQGLLVATGLPLSAIDGIIMGNTPYFEDGTAFYINTINNTTSLYALIPDTGVKSGCVLYMMK